MLGAGCQLTRGRHGEDPFYSSAKGPRKPNNNHRTDQLLRRAQSDVSNGRSANNPKEKRERENESPSMPTNLERFLESVTPSVPAQYLPKVCLNMSNVFI